MRYPGKQNRSRLFNKAYFFAIGGIFVTVATSLLNLNSLFIILLVFIWLLEGNLKAKVSRLRRDPLFIAFLLYLLLQIAGIPLAENFQKGWKEVESKLGFLALPMVFCSSTFLSLDVRKRLLFLFSVIIAGVALYCLTVATYQYFFNEQSSLVFFYHQLVAPVRHHAVYFSMYVFVCLAFLVFESGNTAWLKQQRMLVTAWIIFFLVFLVLLSSKVVLIMLFLFALISAFRSGKKKFDRKRAAVSVIAGTALVAALFLIENPLTKRFADMRGNIEILTLEKYDAGMYFNPWQFRILLWRVSYEIVRDDRAWLTGVGPTNDQNRLKAKYLEMGLYSGEASRNDQGYLEYNCHNQFLQSFLESGIPGLVVVMFICLAMFIKAYRKKEFVGYLIVFLIFAFFFSESVFERQYGMILVTVFPLLYFYSHAFLKNDSEMG